MHKYYKLYINWTDNSGKTRVTAEIMDYDDIAIAIESFKAVCENNKFAIIHPENSETPIVININNISHWSIIELEENKND